MNRRRSKLVVLLAGVLLLSAGALGLWQQKQQRQYALSRQLIAALVAGDSNQALALVKDGADPNIRYKPTSFPSLIQFIERRLHRSALPANDTPTALMIACGTPWTEEPAIISIQQRRPDDSQLVQAMLSHGAAIHPNREDEFNLLIWASYLHRSKTLLLLIDHGANVNVKDEYGGTPLFGITMDKPRLDIVRMLLEHGAKAEVCGDESGHTVLMNAVFYGADPDVIRQLLVHGADPNLVDLDKETPLSLAQDTKRSDIVTLLKQAGARQ